MKIALNLDNLGGDNEKEIEAQTLEKIILGAKAGDFEARDALFAHYMPLLTGMAKKRSADVSVINQMIEGGKKGLLMAASKYKQGMGPDKFKLFALDYIERGMSDATHHGFFSRLFGKK